MMRLILQLGQALPQIIDCKRLHNIKLRKYAESVLDENYKFDLFKADILREGEDILIYYKHYG